jgi:hypothetical protein
MARLTLAKGTYIDRLRHNIRDRTVAPGLAPERPHGVTA